MLSRYHLLVQVEVMKALPKGEQNPSYGGNQTTERTTRIFIARIPAAATEDVSSKAKIMSIFKTLDAFDVA